MGNTIQYLDDYHLPLYGRLPIVAEKASGMYLWDDQGNKYLDMLAGIAVCNTGHCHPKVVKAIQDQAAKLIHVSNIFYIQPQAELIKKLVNAAGLERAFFCNSGAEANEGAIKFIRNYAAKKDKKGAIVSFTGSFHGRTIANLAMGKEAFQKGFEPLPDGFHRLEYNNVEMLTDYIKNNQPIGFILEIIQGEGGINVINDDFIQKIAEICKEQDILLAVDEIQAGFGRTGEYFAYQHYNIIPDIVTCAKGMGSGLPIGAVITNQKIADTLQPGQHGTTFGGNPLVCAAALATMEVLEEEKLLDNAAKMGEYLREQLNEAVGKHPAVKEIRGKGLMVGVALNMEGKEVVTEMLKNGLIGNCASGTVMRFVPPLIINKEQIKEGVAIFKRALEKVYSSNKTA
ncbi:aspartate aminotransferase family protein [Marivirga sp. S37H4]|uniref:Acetylornithine aminotransferase n=1 Tax=Marivirga aurantiaca TaxID=2802615 RepID=A0A934WWE1_9BACT|nr:aspartate aminotransferase family protein [Marivirga aurantiaca]MBK6264120.1 aspartate aminotransferase family protein [Marivirga aurantiaca]